MNNVGDMVCNSFSRPGIIPEDGKLEPCEVFDWLSHLKNNQITKLQICQTCSHLCKDKIFIEEICKQSALRNIVLSRLVFLDIDFLINVLRMKKWKSIRFSRCTFSSFSYSQLMKFMKSDHVVEKFEVEFSVFRFDNLGNEGNLEPLHNMTSKFLKSNYKLLNIKLSPIINGNNLNEIVTSTEERNRTLLKFVRNSCLTFILIRKFRHSILNMLDINLVKHLAKKVFKIHINNRNYLKNLSKQLRNSEI